jgi:hypothetical protein
MGYFHWITGLRRHGFNTCAGNMGVGGGRQDKSETESIEKMRPQNPGLVGVQRSLHTNGWPSIHLQQGVFPQLLTHTRHVGTPYPPSQLEVILLLGPLSSHQFISAALSSPNALPAIKIVYFEFALVVALGVCPADLFLIGHSIAYGAVQSAKDGLALIFPNHLFLHTNGRPKGTKHFPVPGNDEAAAEDVFEGGNHTPVQRRASQKHDPAAYFPLSHHAIQIVVNNGKAETCYEIIPGYALLMVGNQIRFHEDSAPLCQFYGVIRREGNFLKFLYNVDAILVGKFMQKAPRTGGAHLVHVKIKRMRVGDGYVF